MPKVILITGASTGLGETIANYLTKQGFIVYGTSRCIKTEAILRHHNLVLEQPKTCFSQ